MLNIIGRVYRRGRMLQTCVRLVHIGYIEKEEGYIEKGYIEKEEECFKHVGWDV